MQTRLAINIPLLSLPPLLPAVAEPPSSELYILRKLQLGQILGRNPISRKLVQVIPEPEEMECLHFKNRLLGTKLTVGDKRVDNLPRNWNF